MWRKSTFSGPDNECVEVADGIADSVPVCDSKDPHGPVLVFGPGAWRAFVGGVRVGDFEGGR
ncbi:DUF397 domain-containing protein [Kitasatospora sp. NBC_01287]|uniref:DUF397 domain-containing protein n=1 Tax=Kitasatospora sp. NBC_01287 TaxID=2903573 RepID=UPI002B1E8800|nr:DUF397 domain-containing protein [Kitasatospora sp. NBC_01287]